MTHKRKKNERRNRLNLLILSVGHLIEDAKRLGISLTRLAKKSGSSAKRMRYGTPGAFGPGHSPIVIPFPSRSALRFPCAGNSQDRRRFRRKQARIAA